jgi:ubiquinone/menaquinone biosynthesis C-methylase UbiE
MFDKNAARSVWGASPAGHTFGGGAAIGTRAFFENVVQKRKEYEQPWLFDLVPFKSYKGKRVLELGCGAGYDAFEFVRHGAKYTGIDITPENIIRVRQHLGHFGFTPDVREGDAENLTFGDAQFDLVYSNGVLHHIPDIARSFEEANRVLVPGGVFWVILYHRHSVVHWVNTWLLSHVLRGRFLKQSFRHTIAKVETTTSSELPIVNVYSRKELRALLENAGFEVTELHVRKFVTEDFPAYSKLSGLWRHVPQRVLDAIGRRFGWYVIGRGEKRAS